MNVIKQDDKFVIINTENNEITHTFDTFYDLMMYLGMDEAYDLLSDDDFN